MLQDLVKLTVCQHSSCPENNKSFCNHNIDFFLIINLKFLKYIRRLSKEFNNLLYLNDIKYFNINDSMKQTSWKCYGNHTFNLITLTLFSMNYIFHDLGSNDITFSLILMTIPYLCSSCVYVPILHLFCFKRVTHPLIL